jgi:hypothetical protein
MRRNDYPDLGAHGVEIFAQEFSDSRSSRRLKADSLNCPRHSVKRVMVGQRPRKHLFAGGDPVNSPHGLPTGSDETLPLWLSIYIA